ncbi:PLP-dependent cysteine synthase family protein [Nocardia bovistercoris]|uniref:Pyridoxal-phosphate dependent enzyme n=1 Tax=Nocardia bovistercoris TaxID=2785916 RepID=A0A931I9E9_9NOCA|nr:pyridoxal-phosphate dependent enzyme [Nocardia bovistercoris]MBH0777144.1 pyridoxal-phosphate dependent enzyme [Nocardia bovistercoris]
MTVIEPHRAGSFDSLAGAVGETPLVRLNRVTDGIAATVYVKLEYLNPGGSVKDRAARSMLDAAEADGSLRAGGTVVEASSGNTGIGLAALAVARGYRVIVVLPDKSSAEKIALLRAYGVQVHVTPGGRPIGHPEHLRSVALRLVEATPGAWFASQYDNPANPSAHYRTTGPEVWAQTGGRVTHYVAGVGTGGTISGAGEYLKEVSGGAVTVIAADPDSSVYGGGDGRAWYVESVGHYLHPRTEEDEWPSSYHPEVVDRFERIPDTESLTLLHRLAREEGLLLGGSSGTSIAAALRVARTLDADQVVVVVAPDSGRSYLSKYFDDEWLGRLGFPLVTPASTVTVGALLGLAETGQRDPALYPGLTPDAAAPFVLPSDISVAAARALFGSARTLPVRLARPRSGAAVIAEILGSVRATTLAEAPDTDPITDHMDEPLPVIGVTEPVTAALRRIGEHVGPVLVARVGVAVHTLDAARFATAAADYEVRDTVTEVDSAGYGSTVSEIEHDAARTGPSTVQAGTGIVVGEREVIVASGEAGANAEDAEAGTRASEVGTDAAQAGRRAPKGREGAAEAKSGVPAAARGVVVVGTEAAKPGEAESESVVAEIASGRAPSAEGVES